MTLFSPSPEYPQDRLHDGNPPSRENFATEGGRADFPDISPCEFDLVATLGSACHVDDVGRLWMSTDTFNEKLFEFSGGDVRWLSAETDHLEALGIIEYRDTRWVQGHPEQWQPWVYINIPALNREGRT